MLLLCSRTALSPEQEQKIEALARQGLDWFYLVQLAQRHEVSSLLYHSVGSRCRAFISTEIDTELRLGFQRQTIDNLNCTRHLARLLKILNAENIAVIPFKGPLLSLIAYQNIALRSFGDLDILIHFEDIPRVKALLAKEGFHPLNSFTPQEEENRIRSQMGYEFVSKDNQVCIELHWNLVQKWLSYQYDGKALWARAEPTALAGVPTLTFCAEDLLIYLCVHGFKHKWSKLKWICDLAEVVRHYSDLDWELLIKRAREQRCTRIVLLGLSLAHDLLDSTIPNPIAGAIARDKEVKFFTSLVRDILFGAADPKIYESHDFAFHTRLRENPIDRLRYYQHILYVSVALNSKDRAFAPASNAPENLYYFWKVARLITQHRGRWFRWLDKKTDADPESSFGQPKD
jgi:hypothetical protein